MAPRWLRRGREAPAPPPVPPAVRIVPVPASGTDAQAAARIVAAYGPSSGQFDALIAEAREEFLAASVAVWREIDRLASRPEGYHPTAMDAELRKRERAAWERYRDLLYRAP
jgi:hypothetical protein